MEAAEQKQTEQPAVLMVKISFNGPVPEDQLDHFTELLDKELGHVRDTEAQRVFPKSDNPQGGWGMGTSMVMDVERVIG